jgi:hypothetical protein
MASVTIPLEILSKLSATTKSELMALISGDMSAAPVNEAVAMEMVPELMEIVEPPVAAAEIAEPRSLPPPGTKLYVTSCGDRWDGEVVLDAMGKTRLLKFNDVIYKSPSAVCTAHAKRVTPNHPKATQPGNGWRFLLYAEGVLKDRPIREASPPAATDAPVAVEAPAAASRASSPPRTVNNHYSADWTRLPFGPDGTVRIKTSYKGEELLGFCSGPKRFTNEAGMLVATSLNKFALLLRGERTVDAWTCCYYLDRDGSWNSMHAIRTRIAAE